MMLDKTTWEDSESWVTPLSYHFTHSSRLTFFCFTIPIDYVTVSLLVFRNVSDMWFVMPVRLTLGDFGAPGWGSPGFRSEFCCFLHMSFCMAMSLFLCCAFDCLFHAILMTLRWCIRHHFSPTELALSTMPVLRFVCFVCCLACCFFLFLLFVLFCVLVFGIVTTIQDCVAGPYASITVGFIDAPWRHLYHDPIVAINSFHALWSPWRKPRGDGRKKKPSEIFTPKLCWKTILCMRQLSDKSSVVSSFWFAFLSFWGVCLLKDVVFLFLSKYFNSMVLLVRHLDFRDPGFASTVCLE